jgi:uncharacterized protein YdiU (UPF0061 family)
MTEQERRSDDYVLARLASVEASIKSYCEAMQEDRNASNRLSMMREQSLVNSVFEAVRKAMSEERENSRNMFASLESKIHACTTIQDSAIDIMKSDMGEMRIEVTSHDTKLKMQREDFSRLSLDFTEIEKAVKELVGGPGDKAKRTLQAVGAGAVPVAGYGLYKLFESFFHKGA